MKILLGDGLSSRSLVRSDLGTILSGFHKLMRNTTTTFLGVAPDRNHLYSWDDHFQQEVRKIFGALQAEKAFHRRRFTLCEWFRVRVVTISARPFMILARASLGLPCHLSVGPGGGEAFDIQALVQVILGLQNDILGWEKDHQTNNLLNSIQVLVRDGIAPDAAFIHAVDSHNLLVRDLTHRASLTIGRLGTLLPKQEHLLRRRMWAVYIKTVVGFVNAMAEWMLRSRRYQLTLT